MTTQRRLQENDVLKRALLTATAGELVPNSDQPDLARKRTGHPNGVGAVQPGRGQTGTSTPIDSGTLTGRFVITGPVR